MKTRMIKLAGLLFGLAALALAADITGKWTAEFTTPSGQTRTTVFNFKVDGETLTGTVSGRSGDSPISDGKVSGEQVSFTVVRNFGGNEVKFSYKGKVVGEEIQFEVSMETPEGPRTYNVTAKRAAS